MRLHENIIPSSIPRRRKVFKLTFLRCQTNDITSNLKIPSHSLEIDFPRIPSASHHHNHSSKTPSPGVGQLHQYVAQQPTQHFQSDRTDASSSSSSNVGIWIHRTTLFHTPRHGNRLWIPCWPSSSRVLARQLAVNSHRERSPLSSSLEARGVALSSSAVSSLLRVRGARIFAVDCPANHSEKLKFVYFGPDSSLSRSCDLLDGDISVVITAW